MCNWQYDFGVSKLFILSIIDGNFMTCIYLLNDTRSFHSSCLPSTHEGMDRPAESAC